jgi:Na+-driven multidrug efflux pump
VGKNEESKAKKILAYIYIDVTIIGLILLAICIPLRDQFLSLLSYDNEAIDVASSILLVFILINFIENYLGIALSTLKALKKVYLITVIYIFVNVFYVLILLVFKSYSTLGVVGIPISYALINIISIICYSLPLYFLDWRKYFKENLEALETDQNELDNSFTKLIK